MVIDVSAIIAILAREADADEFADTLAAASMRPAPAIAVWETVAGLANQYAISTPVARLNVPEFIRVAEIDIAPIGAVSSNSPWTPTISLAKERIPRASTWATASYMRSPRRSMRPCCVGTRGSG